MKPQIYLQNRYKANHQTPRPDPPSRRRPSDPTAPKNGHQLPPPPRKTQRFAAASPQACAQNQHTNLGRSTTNERSNEREEAGSPCAAALYSGPARGRRRGERMCGTGSRDCWAPPFIAALALAPGADPGRGWARAGAVSCGAESIWRVEQAAGMHVCGRRGRTLTEWTHVGGEATRWAVAVALLSSHQPHAHQPPCCWAHFT